MVSITLNGVLPKWKTVYGVTATDELRDADLFSFYFLFTKSSLKKKNSFCSNVKGIMNVSITLLPFSGNPSRKNKLFVIEIRPLRFLCPPQSIHFV